MKPQCFSRAKAPSVSILACAALVLSMLACNRFEVTYLGPDMISQIIDKQRDKIVFLHNGEQKFLVKSLSWSSDSALVLDLAGTNEPFPTMYQKAFYFPERPKNYDPNQEATITKEVHFFLDKPDVGLNAGMVKLPYQRVKEIHIVEEGGELLKVTTALVLTAILAFFAVSGYMFKELLRLLNRF